MLYGTIVCKSLFDDRTLNNKVVDEMVRHSKIIALALMVLLFFAGCTGGDTSAEVSEPQVESSILEQSATEDASSVAPKVAEMQGADGGVDLRSDGQNINVTHVWDQDECLSDAAWVSGQFVAARRSNLCRVLDTTQEGFYYLYRRGTDPSTSWYAAFGEGYGYTYWRYPATTWFRMPSTGGESELQVQDSYGNYFYQDYNMWFSSAPDSQNISQGYYAEYAVKNELILAALSETYSEITSSTETYVTDAQTEIDRQLQQQNTNDNGGGWTQDQVNIWLWEWKNRMGRIWTQPSCNFSSNGCF